MLLFLLSSRAPVTKDPERDRERPWVLRPMAFLFDRSHGHHFHGFSCFLALELSEGGDITFLGKGGEHRGYFADIFQESLSSMV